METDFLRAMRELGRQRAEARMIAEGIERLELLYPGKGIEDSFDKAYGELASALEEFRDVGLKILSRLVKEDLNLEAELNNIRIRVGRIGKYIEGIKQYNEKHPDSRINFSPRNMSVYCNDIDSKVNECNIVLFKIIKSGRWMDDEARKYKTLYESLISEASRFYHISQTKGWIMHVPRTRNVKGELLHPNASKESKTDSTEHGWLTSVQWTRSMSAGELKPASSR